MNICKIKDINIGDGQPKVCLPIVGKTKEEIIRQAKLFKNITYDLVELRIDYYENILNSQAVITLLNELKTVIDKPILFTYRSLKEGGQVQLTDNQYIELIKNVCQSQLIEIVDIELLSGNQLVYQLVDIAHKNKIKVLISNHNFVFTPHNEEMKKTLEHMEIMNGDILKIAYMPTCEKDVLRLMDVTLEMSQKMTKPIVTMAMGELGKISRISGMLTGSAMTFACLKNASAPGQISLADIQHVLGVLYYD